MSLLMDALKQAEKAKQKTSEGQPEEPGSRAPASAPPLPAAADAKEAASPESPPPSDGGLSLAPEEPAAEPAPARDFEDLIEETAARQQTTPEGEETVTAAEGGEPSGEPSPDGAAAATPTPPETPAAEKEDGKDADTAQAAPAGTDQVTPSPRPESVAQANPAAAAHLLSASRSYEIAERRRYLVAAVVGLLVIVLTVGFYYYNALEERPNLAYTGPQPSLEGTLVAEAPPAAEAPAPTPDATPQPVADTPAPPEPKPASRPAPPLKKKAAAPRPKNKPRIIRATRPGNDLLLAYQAYQAGRLEEARALYLRHLKLQPRSRDALLGLGAIAQHEGRLEDARSRYRAVLALDPADATARAALASLDRPADVPATEAELQMLLRQQPQAAHLHFALGNLYAAQRRWPLAQQQYFEAFRLSPDNPDYAYNLAVALDRLGEQDEALAFYRKALDLNHRGLARFDSLAARARIQALEQGLEGGAS